MIGEWARWEPSPHLSIKYDIIEISDNIDNFYIELIADKNKKIRIVFENSVVAYRNTEESFRSKLIDELSDRYGDEFYGDWTFFKVSNSEYIQWILKESAGIAEGLPLIHYSIISLNSVLDIINMEDPKVIILK